MTTPQVDWFALSPMLALLTSGSLSLLGAVLVPRPLRRAVAFLVTLVGFACALGFAVAVFAESEQGEGIVAGLEVLKRPARFAGVVFWSLLLWLKNAAAFAICFRAFGLDIPLEAALLLQGIIGFGVAVPSTPGFVGVFEAATLVTLRLYGVDSSLAVSYALTYHLTTFLPITLLGFWSLSRLHLGLRELRTAAEGERA